ncbi:hypothetical protein [Dyella sp.]|uniref:hypothetical protein n=1 Tax=Dyella sp. TaxID=1869338 RepID=UPI002FDB4714
MDCNAGSAEMVPPFPELWDMDIWAIQMMSVYQAEVTKRALEHECVEGLRATGVIR